MEKVFSTFIQRYPTPEAFISSSLEDVKELIAPLGFKNRRTKVLFDMTREYQLKDWKDIVELPGIGEYASRAWRIFMLNELGDIEPRDGALSLYWKWRKRESCSSQ